MNIIQQEFERKTGLSSKSKEDRRSLTIFRKGFESGKYYEKYLKEYLKEKANAA